MYWRGGSNEIVTRELGSLCRPFPADLPLAAPVRRRTPIARASGSNLNAKILFVLDPAGLCRATPELTKVTMQAAGTLLTAITSHWKRTNRPLQIACVALPAALFGGLAWFDHRVEFERTRNDVVTATNAIAEHAQTVVETVDLVLARVLDHIEHQEWATLATSLDTHRFLDRLRHELPQVEAIFLVAPDGIVAASSRAYPMSRYDVSAAEYFAVA
jgi:hypothetical protein